MMLWFGERDERGGDEAVGIVTPQGFVEGIVQEWLSGTSPIGERDTRMTGLFSPSLLQK
jgi:hypothetical protein